MGIRYGVFFRGDQAVLVAWIIYIYGAGNVVRWASAEGLGAMGVWGDTFGLFGRVMERASVML